MSNSKLDGTWEQLVCYLPNMTPEIIDDIKQREPVDTMTTVAQYWLDNSPDHSTWRNVIDALERANETQLQVLHVQANLGKQL